MTEVICNGTSLKLVRLVIELDEFPGYLTKGIGEDGRLERTEAKAREIAKRNFPQDDCREFVRAVCLWGDDPRRGGKVIKRNHPEKISKAMKSAFEFSMQGQIANALDAVTKLEGLAVSFGSKHLKFLAPDRHVVLDSIISERLGYTRDVKGYLQWLAACHEFVILVREAGVKYTGIGSDGWRVSDIEMAIFNKIRSE
ncbi:MAG: hypothetical protein B7Y80_03150 [Hyphomicrobium sp. 32-62-53]|nr:MAG: hypothetical protein B7Z29_07120 [Hyphomicrobium sp. 12-62-95]OYY00928.1 MAG: hypothetical protein B7Y80_03150 [Hyphomicrobium sp. 32-62-53]